MVAGLVVIVVSVVVFGVVFLVVVGEVVVIVVVGEIIIVAVVNIVTVVVVIVWRRGLLSEETSPILHAIG